MWIRLGSHRFVPRMPAMETDGEDEDLGHDTWLPQPFDHGGCCWTWNGRKLEPARSVLERGWAESPLDGPSQAQWQRGRA